MEYCAYCGGEVNIKSDHVRLEKNFYHEQCYRKKEAEDRMATLVRKWRDHRRPGVY